MGKPRTWQDEDLIEAVEHSRSMRDCLYLMGLREAGGNYTTINLAIERLDLDNSHWVGQGWLRKGTSTFTGKPLSEILVKNSKYTNIASLKRRLLKEKLLEYICSFCGNRGKWKGQILVLRLDHINGNRMDHRLKNLRFLCPNCDSQTDTFCGRNIR